MATARTPAERTGALDGLRVLDVAGHLGAIAGRILAELGADVVKLEPPTGDPSRRFKPLVQSSEGPLSLTFIYENAGKRGIVLDLERRGGLRQFRDLAARADAIISTEGSEIWARRGIRLEQVTRRFPRLVWTAITPFGLTGPYRDYRGTNIIAEAMGGLMYIQGDDQQPPAVSPSEQAVYLAGLHAVFGTLLALWERRQSGRGQLVDISLQEVVAHIHFMLVRYAYSGEILQRPGLRNPLTPSGYFDCRDGPVYISLFQPHEWDRLARWIGAPTLLDPALRDRELRGAVSEIVDREIQAFVAGFDKWSLTEEAQRRGVPAAPLCDVADLAANEHLAVREFFREFEQPPLGRLRTAGPLFRATRTPLRLRRPAPRLGEHQATAIEPRLGAGSPGAKARARAAGNGLPLAGVRVLDFTRVWAGPFGTRYLADAGAEVIKVESAKSGELHRPGDPSYAEINRNKQPISLDFQTEAGRALARQLAAVSDIVVDNFSAHVMARYGLDFQSLAQERPDLIVVSMPGFGRSGPHSHYLSYGGPLMAYTGMAGLWGYPDSPLNARIKIAYPDFIASGTLALAVLAALEHRERTGEGQFIEISQVEGTAAALEPVYLDYFTTGRVAEPRGNRDPNRAPQGCYPCRGDDAWCVISCGTDEEWQALARAIDREDLAIAAHLQTLSGRQAHHDELDRVLSAWTRERTPFQVMRRLQAAGVPAAAVQTGEDLWRDWHLRARGFVVALEHPDIGPAEHPGTTIHLSRTPARMRRPAGLLGQENAAIFGDLLGLSGAARERLARDGAFT